MSDHQMAVIVQDESDYGGANNFWVKARYDEPMEAEEAVRKAFENDNWKPRKDDTRVVHGIVVGRKVGYREFTVTIHYPPSEIWAVDFAPIEIDGRSEATT